MFQRIVWITGMPRSGTTWLSQIFASHPDVRLKYCPLFSYEFKNELDAAATADQWEDLFRRVYETRGDYLDQEHLRSRGLIPEFPEREPDPGTLAVKSNRFHHLTVPMMDRVPALQVIAIVRHPCATLHSWLSHPSEFPAEADPLAEWRGGACRKDGVGEFWGFDDWMEVTRMHLELAASRPERFELVRHEALARDARSCTARLFEKVGLALHPQTERFLRASQATHDGRRLSVYKDPAQLDRWRAELQPSIRREVERELAGSPLERFLEPVAEESP